MLFLFKIRKSFIPAFLLFFVSFFLQTHVTYASENDSEDQEDIKDTVRSIVLYGNQFLIKPSIEISDELIYKFIDSLFTTPSKSDELLKQIHLFMTVKKKPDNEIYDIIDSLLELEDIPYALINQINYYVATREGDSNKEMNNSVAITSFYDGSEFPANCFYDSWDTKITHPYTEELWKEDTAAIVLVLQDTMNFCNYMHPHEGIITSNFGWRKERKHNGVDIDLRTGDPVLTAFDGKVRIAGNHGAYGNVVIVRHYNGLETLYAHLQRIKVKPGQEIAAGQVIGLGGNTGRSTGSHLHFEVRFKGKPLNPKHIINFSGKELLHNAVVLNKTKWSYSVYPEGAEFHIVERGEYLYEIAERYGLTVKQIREYNELNQKSILKVGQKLRVL